MLKKNKHNAKPPERSIQVVVVIREITIETIHGHSDPASIIDVQRRLSQLKNIMRSPFEVMADYDTDEDGE